MYKVNTIIILSSFCLYSMFGIGQEIQVDLITNLDGTLEESSGLLYLNEKFITHNDSDTGTYLYEIDTLTGSFSREVSVLGAENSDWEDICHDDNYIYIGDFGNNNGERTDLTIYKISIDEYINTSYDVVNAEAIYFNYSDQVDFSPGAFNNNFDAETLISYQDSLYIFTKNWGNFQSNIYSVSKTPGTYEINKIGNIPALGLITGGIYNMEQDEVILTGNYFTSPFIINLSNFEEGLFDTGEFNKTYFQTGGSIQVEGIDLVENNRYIISAETFSEQPGLLMYLDYEYPLSILELSEKSGAIYPIPANETLIIDLPEFSRIEIYNTRGKLVLASLKSSVNVRTLSNGMYLSVIYNSKGELIQNQRIIIEK